MFDPNSPADRRDFFKTVVRSNRILHTFRKNRRETVNDYVGRHYSDQGSSLENLINLLAQAVQIYSMKLAANRPQVLVTAKNVAFSDFAPRFQLAINNYLEEICIDETFRDVVVDAFFCMGFCKTYLEDIGVVHLDNDARIDPGKPFVQAISLDDVVFDVSVSKWSKVSFIGDTYRVSWEKLEEGAESGLYDEKVVDKLSPTEFSRDNMVVSENSEGDLEFRKMIDLVDFYFPETNQVCVWALNSKGEFWDIKETNPLLVYDWNGPEGGPYDRFGFGDVPDGIVSLAPAALLRDMATLVNSLARKSARQAKRQKTIIAAGGEAEQDARRVIRTNDGEVVIVQNPQLVREMRFGGADGDNAAFMSSGMQIFDRLAGNLQTLGGLGASAGTARQEEIVNESSSEVIAGYQERFSKFVASVVRKLGHLIYHDPLLEIPGKFELPGTPYAVDGTWTPEMREGDFLDYNLTIEPYSMQYRSPRARSDMIMQVMERLVFPLKEDFMAQGGVIDLSELIKVLADLNNLPRLKNIVRFSGIPMEEFSMEGSRKERTLPANTTRNYNRHSTSGGDPAQNIQKLLEGMQSSQVQESTT